MCERKLAIINYSFPATSGSVRFCSSFHCIFCSRCGGGGFRGLEVNNPLTGLFLPGYFFQPAHIRKLWWSTWYYVACRQATESSRIAENMIYSCNQLSNDIDNKLLCSAVLRHAINLSVTKAELKRWYAGWGCLYRLGLVFVKRYGSVQFSGSLNANCDICLRVMEL